MPQEGAFLSQLPRSTIPEKTQRINCAVGLLKNMPRPEAVAELARRFDLSLRQSYRYVHLAEQAGDVLPVPEEKTVFTVKLPVSVLERLRALASTSGRSLSDLTSQALLALLDQEDSGAQRKTSKKGSPGT
jgi:hypothetical protein